MTLPDPDPPIPVLCEHDGCTVIIGHYVYETSETVLDANITPHYFETEDDAYGPFLYCPDHYEIATDW